MRHGEIETWSRWALPAREAQAERCAQDAGDDWCLRVLDPRKRGHQTICSKLQPNIRLHPPSTGTRYSVLVGLLLIDRAQRTGAKIAFVCYSAASVHRADRARR
jgi:hypothetical protein